MQNVSANRLDDGGSRPSLKVDKFLLVYTSSQTRKQPSYCMFTGLFIDALSAAYAIYV
jgi:hypothetical protein